MQLVDAFFFFFGLVFKIRLKQKMVLAMQSSILDVLLTHIIRNFYSPLGQGIVKQVLWKFQTIFS